MVEARSKVPAKAEEVPVERRHAPAARERHPIEAFRRELARLLEDFDWRTPARRAAVDLVPFLAQELARRARPAVDVIEKERVYEVTAELPGMDEKDIEVRIANGMLTIKGEKKEEKDERWHDYHLAERRYGTFRRSLQIPQGVDEGRIEAILKKGVLTVTLPKTVEAGAEKSIAVKAG